MNGKIKRKGEVINNMKKCLIILLIIIMLIINGCHSDLNFNDSSEKTKDRFTLERYGPGITIITDNNTRIQYLYYRSGYGDGGLTKLE